MTKINISCLVLFHLHRDRQKEREEKSLFHFRFFTWDNERGATFIQGSNIKNAEILLYSCVHEYCDPSTYPDIKS